MLVHMVLLRDTKGRNVQAARRKTDQPKVTSACSMCVLRKHRLPLQQKQTGAGLSQVSTVRCSFLLGVPPYKFQDQSCCQACLLELAARHLSRHACCHIARWHVICVVYAHVVHALATAHTLAALCLLHI